MRTSIERSTGPTDAAAPAQSVPTLTPSVQAALGVTVWSDLGGRVVADGLDVARDLKSRAKAVHAGDLQPIEAALMGQAETLATMFTNLHLRAKNSTNLETMRTLLTLALKAQSQSRATLETLVETKRPRQLLIARQANIAQHQMVNNDGAGGGGSHRAAHARTDTSANAPIELLEEQHGYSMDAGTTRATVGADAGDAALEVVNRAPDPRGESRRVKKRVQGRPAGTDA